jgi:hypothetical protein
MGDSVSDKPKFMCEINQKIDDLEDELFDIENRYQCDLLLPADAEKRMKEIQIEIAGLLGIQLEETLKSRDEFDICDVCKKTGVKLISVEVEVDTYKLMCKECRDELLATKEEER